MPSMASPKLLVACAAIVACCFALAHAQVAVQPGFNLLPWQALNLVTSARFAPDGRVFASTKDGTVRVWSSLNDNSAGSVLLDLSSHGINDYGDRGLESVNVKPTPLSNGNILLFVAYTVGLPCNPNSDQCLVNGRVSRFEISPTNSVVGNEVIVLQNVWCQVYMSHSLGDILFDEEERLLVSGGEGSNFNDIDYGQSGNLCGDPPSPAGVSLSPPTAEGGALRSQHFASSQSPWKVSYSGTILSLDPLTGNAAAGNPALNSGSAKGRVLAYGLRNPYRGAVQPGTNEVFWGNVGWWDWESIYRIQRTGSSSVPNFGWPCYEGPVVQPSFENLNLNLCNKLYSSDTVAQPFYSYMHTSPPNPGGKCSRATGVNGAAVTGLEFYSGSAFGTAYNGALFFGDYAIGCIWAVPLGSGGIPDTSKMQVFADGVGVVDITQAPDGSLVIADFANARIFRLVGPGSGVTSAVVTASPHSGVAPLVVQFSGSQSVAPSPISYSWDLNGDGNFGDTTSTTPSHTYTSAGSYKVGLQVKGGNGGISTTFTTIRVVTSTSQIPTANIVLPSASLTWAVGDTINVKASIAPAGSKASWQVLLHHCVSTLKNACHLHTLPPHSGLSFSMKAPDHEYYCYLEFILTVTTPAGLSKKFSRRINPIVSHMVMHSSPPGLTLTAASDTLKAPFTHLAVANSPVTVIAPSPQTLNGQQYVFVGWSSGQPQVHTITAPRSTATFTATYNLVAPSQPWPGWTNADVGTVGFQGHAVFGTGGALTLYGSGADFWNVADGGHYASINATGNMRIVARLHRLSAAFPDAKAGVMLRESVAGGSKEVSLLVSGRGWVGFHWRTVTNAQTNYQWLEESILPNQYLRLDKVGTTVQSFISADGKTWSLEYTFTVTLANTFHVGVAVTSHDQTGLCQGVFSAVKVTKL
eukprot:jgi/Chlat1/6804/Chrsp51S06496